MSTLWMIAYDISDNKIRKSIHDQLRDHGQRVQYSVFECRLNKQQLQHLRKQLSQKIEADDRIRWYPLCNWCEAEIHWHGNGNVVETDEFYLL